MVCKLQKHSFSPCKGTWLPCLLASWECSCFKKNHHHFKELKSTLNCSRCSLQQGLTLLKLNNLDTSQDLVSDVALNPGAAVAKLKLLPLPGSPFPDPFLGGTIPYLIRLLEDSMRAHPLISQHRAATQRQWAALFPITGQPLQEKCHWDKVAIQNSFT